MASAVRQSEAQHRAALDAYEAVIRTTERQTRAAYRNVVTGIRRVKVSLQAVESAKQAVEASHHRVEFGNGSQFELLSARNNYDAVLRAYQQTRYDYLTANLFLKLQVGRLTEADLAAVDELLIPPAHDTPNF